MDLINDIKKQIVELNKKIDNLTSLMAESGSKNLLKKLSDYKAVQEQLEAELLKKQADFDFPQIDEV